MWTKNNLKADSYLHEISTEEIKIEATRATQSLKNKKIKKKQSTTNISYNSRKRFFLSKVLEPDMLEQTTENNFHSRPSLSNWEKQSNEINK